MTVKAWLEGHPFDLQDLAELLPAGNVRVVREDDPYYLISPEIDNPPQGVKYNNVAASLLTQINGLARVKNPGFTLARNVDRYHRLIAEADKSPMVAGSTGQQRANPIYDLALKLEQSVKADEQQLGIGPMNRLRLGIAFSKSAKSLAELNAEAEDDADDDPRLMLDGNGRQDC